MSQNNPGCLGWLFKLIGAKTDDAPMTVPYRLRDDFLSPPERSFYHVLVSAIGSKAVVCPKVRLGDLFFVPRATIKYQSYLNKVNRKHIDFILCDPQSMRPLLGVELDDKSHNESKRQDRDREVDKMFEAAKLPIVHIKAAATYNVQELAERIQSLLVPGKSDILTAQSSIEPQGKDETPICPKCGVPLVVRTAARGGRNGEQFWGCVNYPGCRQVINF
jgi:very-short-patch-repair endonuclease